MDRRRLKLIAVWIAGLTVLACSTGDPSSNLPDDPLEVRPTITDLSSYRYDERSIARLTREVGVEFVDPGTGEVSDTVPLPEDRPDATDTRVSGWFIVDTPDDTYVVFTLVVSYPQDGLTPSSTEYWIQTSSRRTGATIYERRIDLPWQPGSDVVVDPAGTAVFNVRMDLGNGVVAIPFLPGRTAWSRDADGSNEGWQANAAADGVVLLSKGNSDEGLYGVDAATGTTLWSVPVYNASRHPDCVVPHGDHFVIVRHGRYEEWPLTVAIHTGAVGAAHGVDEGCAVDPAGDTIVHAGSPIVAYNLPDGRELWSVPRDQVDALGLDVVGVYAGRAYAVTDQERLVLDARTGEELERDWVVFPLAIHDGWILAHHISYRGPVVYPGTELPALTTTASDAAAST